MCSSLRRCVFAPLRYAVLRWLLLLAIALITFARYYTMAAPGLLWGDSAEFQLAAWTAGLAHPTGYPLFLILGWLWTHALAPVFPPTRAMTLLSALFGALTAGGLAVVLYVTLRRTASEAMRLSSQGVSSGNRTEQDSHVKLGSHTGLPLVAGLGALWFALTPTFWSQALIPEVYTLNALFVVVLLWLALRIKARAPERYFALLALTYGASLTHHRTMLLWLPALLAYLTLALPGWWRAGRRLLRLGVLVVLPQLLYLYIPLRGPVTPYLHQRLSDDNVLSLYDGSLRAFVAHVSGTVFSQELGLQMTPAERLTFVLDLGVTNVTWVGVILGLIGLVWLIWQRDWSFLALTGLGFAGIVAFGLLYAIGDVEVMFIPAWLVWIIWSVIGIQVTGAHLPFAFRPANLLLILFLAGLIVWQHSTWADDLDRSGSTSARDRWERILAANPPRDAVLISNDRNEMVPLWYMQFAEGRRRDLFGIFPLITQRPEHADVVRVTQSVLPFERPMVFIKSMPGLAVAFDLQPLREPLVAVLGPAPLPAQPPIEDEVAADLRIAGWEARPERIAAGERLTITLAWRPQKALSHDYTTFVHIFDVSSDMVVQNDHLPGGVYYPSSLWRPGDGVRDEHVVTLPAVLPDGALEVRAGAYRRVGDTIEPLGQSVRVGWVLPAGAPFAPFASGWRSLATFGDTFALLGAELPQRVAAGETLAVDLRWGVLDDAPRALHHATDWTLFVHLVPAGSDGSPLAQYDGPAVAGYPTSAWPAGTMTGDTVVTLSVPATLPAGRYDVLVGFYDPTSGRRLSTGAGDGFADVGSVTILEDVAVSED